MDVSSRFEVAGFGVIVTGGASGLGLAYGEVLATHGARVTLIDVDADAVASQAAARSVNFRVGLEGVSAHTTFVSARTAFLIAPTSVISTKSTASCRGAKTSRRSRKTP